MENRWSSLDPVCPERLDPDSDPFCPERSDPVFPERLDSDPGQDQIEYVTLGMGDVNGFGYIMKMTEREWTFFDGIKKGITVLYGKMILTIKDFPLFLFSSCIIWLLHTILVQYICIKMHILTPIYTILYIQKCAVMMTYPCWEL